MVRRSKIRTFVATGALLFGSVIVAAVIAEMLVRLFSPQPVGRALPIYQSDTVLLHRLRPGFKGTLKSNEFEVAITINSLGFRGLEWVRSSGRRILVLGDSFTFGYGVPEIMVFTELLQDSLRQLSYDVTVYNAGVPGYGTTQEQRLLQQLWPLIEPQVVIVAFTVGSDLRNIIEQNLQEDVGYQVRNGYLVPKGMRMGRALPIKAFFQERSHLYVLLQKTRARMSLRDKTALQTERPCEHFLAKNPCGKMATAWKIVACSFGEILSRCDKAGAQLVILAIPHPVQVYDDLWEREMRQWHSSTSLFDRFGVQVRLHGMADSLGITLVDPLVAFRDASRQRLYYTLDRHLTASGHTIVASKLLQVIKGMVKGESE